MTMTTIAIETGADDMEIPEVILGSAVMYRGWQVVGEGALPPRITDGAGRVWELRGIGARDAEYGSGRDTLTVCRCPTRRARR